MRIRDRSFLGAEVVSNTRRVLIFGAHSDVGSCLIPCLAEAGWSIYGFTRKQRRTDEEARVTWVTAVDFQENRVREWDRNSDRNQLDADLGLTRLSTNPGQYSGHHFNCVQLEQYHQQSNQYKQKMNAGLPAYCSGVNRGLAMSLPTTIGAR